jgi:tetratricopeptide (TPR) repeat protein
MYALLPLLLVFLSVGIILVLIVRKFPQLTLLDVESIPEVKEEKKKNEFLKKRAEKKNAEAKEKKKARWDPMIHMAKKVRDSFRSFFASIEKKVFHDAFARARKNKIEQGISPEQEIPALLQSGRLAYENQDYNLAEKKYIEVIRLAPKNAESYQGLAEVYIKFGQKKEAEETLQFVHHLTPHNDDILVLLAELCEETGRNHDAMRYYEKALLLNDGVASRFAKYAGLLEAEKQYPAALEALSQALELESENPKYLDNIIELAIMMNNKELAEEYYKKLRLVNSHNQKLLIFKDKIQGLG